MLSVNKKKIDLKNPHKTKIVKWYFINKNSLIKQSYIKKKEINNS